MATSTKRQINGGKSQTGSSTVKDLADCQAALDLQSRGDQGRQRKDQPDLRDTGPQVDQVQRQHAVAHLAGNIGQDHGQQEPA